MNYIIALCFLHLFVVFTHGSATDEKHDLVLQTPLDTSSPRKFPNNSDTSTPIIIGNDPKSSHLPPKMFPISLPEHNSTGPPILSGSEADITEIKNNNHESKLNSTSVNTSSGTQNSTSINITKEQMAKNDTEKSVGEQDDMLHSAYKGGKDVDELLKPEKKATEKDEKKSITSKKDLKSEIDVSANFDKKGPKLMNETKTKSGESVIESTSKMMAVSSSVLSNTKTQHHGIIEPTKTFVTMLLSVAVVVCLGVIGLLVWKKIAMRRFGHLGRRRFGRDVLINEDDFDEVSDMHTFDRAQIQIT